MTDSIFTTQVPASHDVNDGNPIVTGTKFRSVVDGNVTHVRFWAPVSIATGTFIGYLWQAIDRFSGTLLGTTPGLTVATGLLSNQFNTIALPTPIAITAGVVYQVGIFSSAGYYVASPSFFNVNPTFNGNLEAIKDNTLALPNGSYDYDPGGPHAKYPSSFFQAACYFPDVVFVPTGAPAFDPKKASGFLTFF